MPGPKATSKLSFLLGDSNETKLRVAEYSTILFQQGEFLSRVRPTKFKAFSQVTDGHSDQTCMKWVLVL